MENLMLDALEKVLKDAYDSNQDTLEGHIGFDEMVQSLENDVKDSDDKVFTLRIKEGLFKRFDNAIKFDNTTKSKVIRALIEYYVIQTEQEMARNEDRISKILMLDEMEQMQEVMKLSDDEKLQYLKLKQKRLEDLEKEKRINRS